MNRSRGSFAAACVAVLCGLIVAGCGGGSGGDTEGSGTIGTSGGTVSLPSGPTVVVPSGALPADRTITVTASTATAPAGAVSSLYQFGPAGTTFTVPVTVTFPVPAGTKAADVAVYWTKPGSTTEWDVLPATVSGATASASVTHFSDGFVGAACAVDTACTPANACHTGVTTCNGTPACADSGTPVADGAACGGGNVCTAGVCGAAQCTAGQTCTPPTTPDACKTYATTCDTSGVQTCGVSGNAADGTSCGSGLTCSSGTCGSSGSPPNYFPSGTSRRYSVTPPSAAPPSGLAAYTTTDQSVTTTATGESRTTFYSNGTAPQTRVLVFTGGEAAVSSVSSATTTTYDPPLLLLPADQTPGATTTKTSTVTQGTTTGTMTRAVTVNGIESVTVPAGTYAALKVTTRITSTLSGYVPSQNIAWYAPDVGLVKSVSYPEATPSSTTTQELTGTTGMLCAAGSCACNDVVNEAPVVPGLNVPSSLPTGLGGAIADGTYDLTARHVFTGSGGASGPTADTLRISLVVAGGTMQRAVSSNGGADLQSNSFYSVNGTNFTLTHTCGAAGGIPLGAFTATPDEIRLVYPTTPPATLSGFELVFTRRGATACVPGLACTPANACHTGVTTCFGASACADTGTPVADGTTCGGTNYCSAGTCSRTVTITNYTSYWDDTATDAPTTNVPVTTIAYWVNYVAAAGAQRVEATPSAAGSATYSVPGVPVGKYWIEERGNGGANAPAYLETARDAVDFGRDRYGRADAVSAANPSMTKVTFNYSNMNPWVSGSDTVEAFSSNLGMVDYSFGAYGNSVEGWGPGATTGTGVHNWFLYTPLVEPAKGDTTYFTQLTTRTVTAGATTHTYSAVDRFHFSDTFAVVNMTPTTIEVPFVAPTASVPVAIDWRLSEYAALLPTIHPTARSSGASVAIQGQPHLLTASPSGPLVMNSWGGWPDLLGFVPVDRGADVNLGDTSFSQFLPSTWGTFRIVWYDATVSVLAQGATTPYGQWAGLYSYEAFPGASNPIRPLVTPVTAPLINGLDAYAARTGVTATPTISWTASSVLPGTGSVNGYWLSLFQLGTDAAGATTRTLVASWGGLTGTSFQVPPGFLVAGTEYYAVIEVRAGGTGVDGSHMRQWLPMALADTVTGIFTP